MTILSIKRPPNNSRRRTCAALLAGLFLLRSWTTAELLAVGFRPGEVERALADLRAQGNSIQVASQFAQNSPAGSTPAVA